MYKKFFLLSSSMLILTGCETISNEETKPTIINVQRGQGLPFEVIGSQVWDVKDP